MKKRFFFLIVSFLAMSSITANAQYFCVYDGASFNLLVTYNKDNKVTDISFSNEKKTEWVKLTLIEFVDFEDLEEDEEDEEDEGFLCYTKDTNNTYFNIMCFYTTDALLVTNQKTGTSWKLYQRK